MNRNRERKAEEVNYTLVRTTTLDYSRKFLEDGGPIYDAELTLLSLNGKTSRLHIVYAHVDNWKTIL